MASVTAIAQPAFDLPRCFNEAIVVYRKNLLVLVLAAFIFEALATCSLFILAGPLYGGFCLMSLRALQRDDRSIELGDLFATLHRFARQLGLFWLTTIPILIGTLLFVIPGLILSTLWIYCFYLVVDRDQGVVQSLRTSYHIVMRKGFGWHFLLALIQFALVVAPIGIPYVGFLIGWLVLPLTVLVATSAYLQVVQRDKGMLDDLFVAVPEKSPAFQAAF